jgi:hypothetical protein
VGESLRFRQGTKIRVAWLDARGRTRFKLVWANQVDGFILQFSSASTGFRVKGLGWKDWKPYDPRLRDYDRSATLES